jgi:cardiolipin-specific phospholipase
MGGSSRPKFKIKTLDETDAFLVGWLEKWRVAMGNIKGFVLAGHSFGGYICALYACKYPQYIKKLLLLSPAGVPIEPDGFDLMKEIKKVPEEERFSNFYYRI